MFNRRIVATVLMLCIGSLLLGLNWVPPAGVPLPPGGVSVVSAKRWTMSLTGTWERYSSLGQAWAAENGHSGPLRIGQQGQINLPASTPVRVVARRFRIPAEWSARTMYLALSGVQGHAAVYLNGVDSADQVGKFEGLGGLDVIEIPPAAFHYGQDNLLFIQLSTVRTVTGLFSLPWPQTGIISGNIYLEGVVDTTLENPQVNVSWQQDSADITVQAKLVHNSLSVVGPWAVTAVLSDGSAGVAQQTINVDMDESPVQTVTLHLMVPSPHRWSPQDPFLYQLHLTVENRKGDQDDLSVSLGLRTLDLSGGVWHVNGQALPIKGVLLSEEQQFALRRAGQVKDWLTAERNQGVNLVYFAGGIPDSVWLETADAVGMGVWVEWPVSLVPAGRLPAAEVFAPLVQQVNLHPSVWAWTVGKEMDWKAAGTATFLQQAANLVKPNLAFALRLRSAPVSTAIYPANQVLLVQGGQLQAGWGVVQTMGTSTGVRPVWPGKIVTVVWAVIVILVTWFAFRARSWRYKEISVARPRRWLRRTWFWHGLALFIRESTLAGIVTGLVFWLPTGFGPWFPHQWPALERLQAQSPWLIWFVLAFALVLIRFLQVGVAAPHLPGEPHPLGLVYWLERRYRWIVIVAGLWIAQFYGWPVYWPLAAYAGLTLLFMPWRIHDVHRVGGRYRLFWPVPLVLAGAAMVWAAVHWADWVFVVHML